MHLQNTAWPFGLFFSRLCSWLAIKPYFRRLFIKTRYSFTLMWLLCKRRSRRVCSARVCSPICILLACKQKFTFRMLILSVFHLVFLCSNLSVCCLHRARTSMYVMRSLSLAVLLAMMLSMVQLPSANLNNISQRNLVICAVISFCRCCLACVQTSSVVVDSRLVAKRVLRFCSVTLLIILLRC